MQRILVMSAELHKSHVGTLRELRYAANTREESEELELSNVHENVSKKTSTPTYLNIF